MRKLKLTVLMGTRPEVIKLAPIVRAGLGRGHQVTVINTGQHRELTRLLFDHFGFKPTLELNVMQPNQTLSSLSARILGKLDESKSELVDSDAFIVQGDTTSAWIGAYWAFLNQVPVAHVESGLRTGDLMAPFPEEANRQLIGRLASFHFAPTKQAATALKREGVSPRSVFEVGNTGIDSLLYTQALMKKHPPVLPPEVANFIDAHPGAPLGLITAHRRESFGPGFELICDGLLAALKQNPKLRLIYPMHPNPNVRDTMVRRLGQTDRILLCEPLDYPQFVYLMDLSKLLITDSGGVQEEGPSLKKPILVLRNETERPEGVKKGFAKLVGTRPKSISSAIKTALARGCQGRGPNPYGDGKTAKRILASIEKACKKSIRI